MTILAILFASVALLEMRRAFTDHTSWAHELRRRLK